jgi:hypothetical protein
MRRGVILLLAAILAEVPTAIRANPASAIQSQPDAPIRITSCSSKTGHYAGKWGTESDTLHLSVDFTNTSTRDVAAVLAGFELQNQFGTVLGRVTTQASGDFSPSVQIADQHWDGEDEWPGFSTLICSVRRVLFKDGSVWKADDTTPSNQ